MPAFMRIGVRKLFFDRAVFRCVFGLFFGRFSRCFACRLLPLFGADPVLPGARSAGSFSRLLAGLVVLFLRLIGSAFVVIAGHVWGEVRIGSRWSGLFFSLDLGGLLLEKGGNHGRTALHSPGRIGQLIRPFFCPGAVSGCCVRASSS